MEKIKQQLKEWGAELESFRLPRWEELPDLELYMDQVITLIDRYLSPVIQGEKHPLLTSSMVNNYVKLGLIPAPTKKIRPTACCFFDSDHIVEASLDDSRNQRRYLVSRKSSGHSRSL